MQRTVLLVVALVEGCGGGSEPNKTPQEAPAARDADRTPAAPEADKPIAKEPDAKTPDPEPAPEPAPPAAEAWLVWSAEGPETRWIEVVDGKASVVATAPALILSDGAKLWRIDRHSSTVAMLPCECMEDERPPDVDCSSQESAEHPWLESTELGTAKVVALTEKGGATDYGYDAEYGVAIQGGAGSLLFFETSISGYFCGAHGLYESTWRAYDVAKNERFDPKLLDVGRGLPKEAQTAAAEEIRPEVEMCGDDHDGDGFTVEAVLDDMELASLSVAVGEEPVVSWAFDHMLPYVCSPDYAAHGSTNTGLHAAAAGLGLGPATPGQRLAMAAHPSRIGGWAQITAKDKEREALLELFRATRAVAEAPAPAAAVDTGTLLNDARRATRTGDYAEAIKALDKLLAADPDHARGWSSRGYAKLLSGDLDGAKTDLQTAAKKKADDDAFTAAIHFNLGMLAEKQGDLAEARKEYQRSNELRASKPAQSALDRLAAPK